MRKLRKLKRILTLSSLCLFTVGAAGNLSADAAPIKQSSVMENRVAAAKTKKAELLGQTQSPLSQTDPNFVQIMERFTYGEVYQQGNLTAKQRELVSIAVLSALNDNSLLTNHITAALNIGVSPVEIKEVIHQVTPYIGFPKAIDALTVTNEVFKQNDIALPLEDQAVVDESNRFTEGLAVQKEIFGEVIDQAYKNAPNDQLHIQHYLSGFCFGDTYTRNAIDLKDRELLTLSAIISLGGCEPQVKAHIIGNLNVGNSKETIISAISQCVPYIGFPRTLNALNCVNEIAGK